MDKLCLMSVDDEEDNQFIIQMLFEESYELKAAHSGEECLEMLKSCTPDLILMDVAMPGIDGYETCHQLKQNPNLKDVPVIFLSARIQAEDRIKGYQAGGHDYMVKPFDHEELIAKVKKTIQTVVGAQQEKSELNEQIRETNDIVLQSMEFSYNLIHVLQFFEDSFQCQNIKELSETFFDAAQQLELNASIQFRHNDKMETYSASGVTSQLEIDVLNLAKDKGRFFDFDRRTIINDENLSILIKNMPDDEQKYGPTKDVLTHFLKALVSREKVIYREQERLEKREQALNKIISILEDLNTKFFELNKESMTTLEDMVEHVREVSVTYHLTETQEDHLFGILETNLDKNNKLFNQGLKLDNVFEDIKNAVGTLK